MGKELPEQYELVTGGGFNDSADARSTKRELATLMGYHEEADTRLILDSCDAVNEGYQRVVAICRDTDACSCTFSLQNSKRSIDDIWYSYKQKVFSNTCCC